MRERKVPQKQKEPKMFNDEITIEVKAHAYHIENLAEELDARGLKGDVDWTVLYGKGWEIVGIRCANLATVKEVMDILPDMFNNL